MKPDRQPVTGFDAFFDERIDARIEQHKEAFARPELVTQRTVERVLSMPGRDYLDHCRKGHWPSWGDRRLRYSKTSDVVDYITSHPVARAANDGSGEALVLGRVRAQRVSA